MKILLVGELSGVHQELKRGLTARGHQVVTAHSGDTYRQFPSDIPLHRPSLGGHRYIASVRQIASELGSLRHLVGYDVIQFVSPKFFHWRLQPQLMPYLFRRNRASVMVNAACSSDYNAFVRQLEYRPCAECKRFDLHGGDCIYERAEEIEVERRMYGMVDAIVSTGFEYHGALAGSEYEWKNQGIPLPVDTDSYRFQPLPPLDGRIRIYYGRTRHGFKGGASIEPALQRIERDFPDEVEVMRTDKLSFSAYLEALARAHIVVDQTNSYSEGMNALYAMAMGKVALTGAEPAALAFKGARPGEGPINIRPDPEHVYETLKGLIWDRVALPSLGLRARNYVVKYHDTRVISEMYERLYRRVLDNRNSAGRNDIV